MKERKFLRKKNNETKKEEAASLASWRQCLSRLRLGGCEQGLVLIREQRVEPATLQDDFLDWRDLWKRAIQVQKNPYSSRESCKRWAERRNLIQ